MSMQPGPSSVEPELGQQITSAAASFQATSSPVLRSCHTCNKQKTRCDKQTPCSSCKRSGKTCSYPLPGPRMRRPKKTIVAEMASRISSLEKSLATAIEGQNPGQATLKSSTSGSTNLKPSAQPSKERPSSNLKNRSREGVLVQKGSSSQYFNEILLSRVIEQVSFTDEVSTAIWLSDSWSRKGISSQF